MTTTEPETDDYDALVGANIRDVRLAQNMTQTDLVNALAKSGIAWRQQTVTKIENGARPLRLVEAQAVAEALLVRVDDLLQDRSKVQMAAHLADICRDLDEMYYAFVGHGSAMLTRAAVLRRRMTWLVAEDHWQDIPKSILDHATQLARLDIEQTLRGIEAKAEAHDQSRDQFREGMFLAHFDPEDWR